jgi:hypothetical protein
MCFRNIVLYNAMAAGDSEWGRATMPWELSGYYSPWLFWLPMLAVYFGNYIIMNLFISILLSGFADEEDEEHDKGGDQDSSGIHRPF